MRVTTVEEMRWTPRLTLAQVSVVVETHCSVLHCEHLRVGGLKR